MFKMKMNRLKRKKQIDSWQENCLHNLKRQFMRSIVMQAGRIFPFSRILLAHARSIASPSPSDLSERTPIRYNPLEVKINAKLKAFDAKCKELDEMLDKLDKKAGFSSRPCPSTIKKVENTAQTTIVASIPGKIVRFLTETTPNPSTYTISL